MAKTADVSTRQIMQSLRGRYLLPEWVFLEELPVEPGAGYWLGRRVKARRIDAWAINCYNTLGRPYLHLAFEVKTSRSDFLAELRDPEKRQPALLMSNEFYFVAPEGLLTKTDLPEEAGLIIVREDGTNRMVRRAPYRKAGVPDWWFMSVALRRATGHRPATYAPRLHVWLAVERWIESKFRADSVSRQERNLALEIEQRIKDALHVNDGPGEVGQMD